MRTRTRLLVVDDSAFSRVMVTRQFKEDGDVEVVGIARDGVEALEKVRSLKPDVVTMDIEMPRMDGLTTLGRIMAESPTRVLMISSRTSAGSEATLRALELGAVDFLCKPARDADDGMEDFGDELREKVRMAAGLETFRLRPALPRPGAPRPEAASRRASPQKVRLAVIGCSTGGPKALQVLIPALPRDLPYPVVVVQHMPPGFTRSMAQRLNGESSLAVKEAEEGDPLRAGQVLVAPGGCHVTFGIRGTVQLDQGPPQCGVRPAVDVTLESAARVMGAHTVGVVLTGMGSDGTRGASLVKQSGGFVIAEAEETCVVYGMPKSVAEAGHADLVLPLHRIADHLAGFSA